MTSSDPNDPAEPSGASTGDPHRDLAGDVTRLLEAVRGGADGAEDALLAAVYQELRDLARARVRRERDPVTLQPTALVHEAWLRLRESMGELAGRSHFFGASARVMRQILVERYRRARRRGVAAHDIDDVAEAAAFGGVDLIALDEALDALERHDARMAQVVQLRYFAGLSVEEAAEALGVSERTVKREWAVARAWLFRHMA